MYGSHRLFVFARNTDKTKIRLEVQFQFLMHSCSGWNSLFLPRCWRGVCAMLCHTLSILHGPMLKGRRTLCWFSRTTLSSQHNCL